MGKDGLADLLAKTTLFFGRTVPSGKQIGIGLGQKQAAPVFDIACDARTGLGWKLKVQRHFVLHLGGRDVEIKDALPPGHVLIKAQVAQVL